MHKSTGVLFLASAVASGIIGLGRDSAAVTPWRAVDAAGCHTPGAADYTKFDYNGSTITTANSLILYCPIIEGSDLAKTNTTMRVDIDQYNPSQASYAAACYNSESALAGSCGNFVSTGTGLTGLRHITVTTNWPSTDYGFAQVLLAPKYSGTMSKIKGYYWWQ